MLFIFYLRRPVWQRCLYSIIYLRLRSTMHWNCTVAKFMPYINIYKKNLYLYYTFVLYIYIKVTFRIFGKCTYHGRRETMQLQNAPYMFHVPFAFLWIVQIVWYLVQCKKEKLSLMRFNVHRDHVCSSGQVTLKVKRGVIRWNLFVTYHFMFVLRHRAWFVVLWENRTEWKFDWRTDGCK